jgi:plasmid stabilization system protein ParE
MNDRLPVEISSLAAQHIRELESWWRRNRTSAPNAVREELQRAVRLVTMTPFIGHPAVDVELPDVRRIHISRIWYYLYYRVAENPRRIEVLALWSESRDGGPPI